MDWADYDYEAWVNEAGGVVGVREVASLFEMDLGAVREWARDADVPRIGGSFAFTSMHLESLAADLDEEGDEGQEEAGDEDDEPEDDEDEDDEPEDDEEG